MSAAADHHAPTAAPEPGDPTIPELEDDQTIAPRSEEELADLLRAEPDVADHSQHPDDKG